MSLLTTITDYFRTSKSELEKVSWPSRQDTIRYSALVIGISILVAAFFAVLDSGLTKLVDATLTVRQTQTQTPATLPVVPTTVDASSTTLTPVGSGSVPINLNGATPIQTPTPAPTPSKK